MERGGHPYQNFWGRHIWRPVSSVCLRRSGIFYEKTAQSFPLKQTSLSPLPQSDNKKLIIFSFRRWFTAISSYFIGSLSQRWKHTSASLTTPSGRFWQLTYLNCNFILARCDTFPIKCSYWSCLKSTQGGEVETKAWVERGLPLLPLLLPTLSANKND